MQSYRRVRQHLERQRNIKRAREQEKSGGAAFRNRATRKPPRPQHLDCNLALIDIQMVIPEQLGSTEIVHGQLSFDCALPSAPRLGYSRRTSPKQPRVCQTRSLGGVQVSKLPLSLALSTGGPTPGPKSLTNIIPTSQVNYCIHSSRVVCKVGPPAAQAQGKVSNISTKSRESSPGFQVGNVYLSQKTIGGLPTARTRNSDGLDRPPPVSGVSDPAVSSIRTESIAQANMPTHLPALNQGRFGLPHALFNPLYLLCSKASCQRVHPFSGVIVEP
ncbi:hypothetical protein J3E71DRAFT_368637 [Bipolaris maydis]|nr:hypothetical protein J3E71DRAFT_368637 [Bipolaris maydis]